MMAKLHALRSGSDMHVRGDWGFDSGAAMIIKGMV